MTDLVENAESSAKPKTSRFTCFTLNNYKQEHIDKLAKLVSDGEARYIVFQEEIGANGTPHLQGYVEFGGAVGWNRLNTLVGCKAHLEKRQSTGKLGRRILQETRFSQTWNRTLRVRNNKRWSRCAKRSTCRTKATRRWRQHAQNRTTQLHVVGKPQQSIREL